MKKLLLLVSILLFSGCSSNNNTHSSSSIEEKKTPIDVILLAGQSNAAGYSAVLENETEEFDNVRYAGMTDKTMIGDQITIGSDFITSKDKYTSSITQGLGHADNYIGPEYGIAKELNDEYSDKHPLMVIKTASGGTTLSDVSSNLSGTFGNWHPKSLWKDGYTPDTDTPSKTKAATGLLYKLFIDNFRMVYNTLVEDNYEVNILGMVWMQGESDADLGGTYISNYGNLLRTFINDVRSDIGEITNDDWLRNEMPFVIGKIATTYYGYNRDVNIRIRQQQDNVANVMDNVECVETEDLVIIKANGQRNEGCVDDWHFNFNDMVTLGKRFANKVIELN